MYVLCALFNRFSPISDSLMDNYRYRSLPPVQFMASRDIPVSFSIKRRSFVNLIYPSKNKFTLFA